MSDQNQEVGEKSEGKDFNVNDLMLKINQLESTNERLLRESMSHKTKKSEYEELQSKLKALEDEKLQKEGNWQEMIKRLQEEKSSVETKLRQKDNEILKGNIYSTVTNIAKDAHDVGDLLAQSEYAKIIEVDEETLRPTRESVEMFIGKLRESKPYLFKNRRVADMADSKGGIDKPINKTLDQMSEQERKIVLQQAISKW